MGSPGGLPSTEILRVGTPMWAHRPWVGRHLPSGTPVGRELDAFATVCSAVEGNTTFYALPDPATVRRWLEATPDSFRFVFKLPRTISHDRRLRDCGPELAEFMRLFAALLPRLGPTTVQLPPTFEPGQLDHLRRFLATLSTEWTWAVEVRHRGFFDGDAIERSLNELLAEYGVERVVLDSRALFASPATTPVEIETHQRKPNLPVRPVAIGSTPIVRFIGQSDVAANPTFWAPWVDKVADWLAGGRSPIVFLHTPDNLDSPAMARAFHDEVRARRPSVQELPVPAEEPQQQLW